MGIYCFTPGSRGDVGREIPQGRCDFIGGGRLDPRGLWATVAAVAVAGGCPGGSFIASSALRPSAKPPNGLGHTVSFTPQAMQLRWWYPVAYHRPLASPRTTGKMGGAMWLCALEQQTERIRPLTPSLLLNPRLCCYYAQTTSNRHYMCSGCALIHCVVLHCDHFRAP